jgi:hypothetical protein
LAKSRWYFQNPNELIRELLADEFRKGDAAKPVGEGKYTIVKYHQHTELVYLGNAKRAWGSSEGVRYSKRGKLVIQLSILKKDQLPC